jgi:hypothetical protein
MLRTIPAANGTLGVHLAGQVPLCHQLAFSIRRQQTAANGDVPQFSECA